MGETHTGLYTMETSHNFRDHPQSTRQTKKVKESSVNVEAERLQENFRQGVLSRKAVMPLATTMKKTVAG